MLPDVQHRIAVVLVRARNPANIGAVARAMHDFGYTDLRVVNEYPIPFQAAKSAVDASSVLTAAHVFTSVAAAIADCHMVYGTTAVGERVLEHPLETLDEASLNIAARAASGSRVALLFGSEKTGLSNDELSHCNALLTIPMNPLQAAGEDDRPRHLSMNLGQAAAVCLYTLAHARRTPASLPAPPSVATAGELERISSLLGEVFLRSGYARRHPANAREANVRRIARRMALSQIDATVWTGVLRQMLHVLPPAEPTNEQAESPRLTHPEEM